MQRKCTYMTVHQNHPPIKLLLCGPSGAGKSWLIRHLCREETLVFGFTTGFHETGGVQGLYIQRAFSVPCFTPSNCIGYRGGRPGSAVGRSQIFETEGVSLLRDLPAGATVVMDELGYLEAESPKFLGRVEEILTGDFRVLGAIKPLPFPHLLRLQALPGVTVLHLTPETRQDVAQRAAALWNGPNAQLPLL